MTCSVQRARLPQDALLDGTQCLQRSIAAAIPKGATRFETVDSGILERETQQQASRIGKYTGAPEGRREDEAPLAEARHVDVHREHLEVGGRDRLGRHPERVPRKVG